MKDKQQKLIDIMFEIGLTIKTNSSLQKMTDEELTFWIRKQLSQCGFETEPLGASWGILINNNIS